jgi:hypothetical protein
MRAQLVRLLGLALNFVYAALIVWIYAQQPQSLSAVAGGMAAAVGAYAIDRAAFDEGLAHFRQDRHGDARAAFERADPAHRDAPTQFYIAYTYYREGWGRVWSDDAAFARGLEAVDRAIAVAPQGQLTVNDDTLSVRTAHQLKAELEAGLRRDASDLNPLRVFRQRP